MFGSYGMVGSCWGCAIGATVATPRKSIHNWLVVWNMLWNMFYFSIGSNNPNWLSNFSEGLKPPTRNSCQQSDCWCGSKQPKCAFFKPSRGTLRSNVWTPEIWSQETRCSSAKPWRNCQKYSWSSQFYPSHQPALDAAWPWPDPASPSSVFSSAIPNPRCWTSTVDGVALIVIKYVIVKVCAYLQSWHVRQCTLWHGLSMLDPFWYIYICTVWCYLLYVIVYIWSWQVVIPIWYDIFYILYFLYTSTHIHRRIQCVCSVLHFESCSDGGVFSHIRWDDHSPWRWTERPNSQGSEESLGS